jgi:sugar phosphate isomerase/epimerase
MWKHAEINGELTQVIVPNVCSFGKYLAEYYGALDSKYFAVCLDVGHCVLVGEKAEDAILELGHDRLHSLHVHDNDGKQDLHTFPYLGTLDWDAIMGALKKIDYSGVLTFEVGGPLLVAYANKPELLKKVYELLAVTGKTLANKFLNFK